MTICMEEKNKIPISHIEDKDTHTVIRFYFAINHLKQLYRQGWLKRGVAKEHTESVADHSFATALLAFLLARTYATKLDVEKIIKLALIHDVGEVYAGDITPLDGISLEEKRKKELEAFHKIFSEIPEGKEFIDLWEDFEYQKSEEAIFVKLIDRLEMGLQAAVYEKQGYTNLHEFFESVAEDLKDSPLQEILTAIEDMRDTR